MALERCADTKARQMSTLLIVAVAIALPLFLVLTLLAPARQSMEPDGRSWRIAATTGSVLSVLMALALFAVGAVAFLRAPWQSDRWTAMAISLVMMTEGARMTVLFLPSGRGAALNQIAVSCFVRASGYCLVTVFLLIAAFAESWWRAPFAGLAGWLAGMSAWFARRSTGRNSIGGE